MEHNIKPENARERKCAPRIIGIFSQRNSSSTLYFVAQRTLSACAMADTRTSHNRERPELHIYVAKEKLWYINTVR